MERFPDVVHYACFDTVFHQTMPVEATTYPVPKIYREPGVKRYGFHGLTDLPAGKGRKTADKW